MDLTITPERGHILHQNEVHIVLVEGVEESVPERFLPTLLAEGVITKRQLEALKKQPQASKPVATKTNAEAQPEGNQTELSK